MIDIVLSRPVLCSLVIPCNMPGPSGLAVSLTVQVYDSFSTRSAFIGQGAGLSQESKFVLPVFEDYFFVIGSRTVCVK